MPIIKFPYHDQRHAYIKRLVDTVWGEPGWPMQLSRDLTFDDVGAAPLFHICRALMSELAEQGGTPATATGNLSRVFVRTMFERINLSRHQRDMYLSANKVFNETDLWPLHLSRLVCEFGGLILRRRGRFNLTHNGRLLLDDAHAGLLYRQLFIAHFRELDLHYRFPYRDVPCIQATFACILWRMSEVVRDLMPVVGMTEQLLLPEVLEECREAQCPNDDDDWILCGLVLTPLLDFGLIETNSTAEPHIVAARHILRITPLFGKFIQFAE